MTRPANASVEAGRPSHLACGPVALLAVALLSSSCASDEPAAANWSIRLAEPTLADRIHVVEAMLLRGGCAGDEVIYRAEIAADGRGPSPGVLPTGRYGLAAHARDLACRTIARGCVDVTLPPVTRSAFEVVLEPVDEAPACEANACRDGRCDGAPDRDAAVPPPPADAGPTVEVDASADEDAGNPNAVPDAMPHDGGVRDAAVRDAGPTTDAMPDAATPMDAGPRDTGPPDAGPPDLGPPPEMCRLDRCYEVLTTAVGFDAARGLCRGRSGDLVTFTDTDEETFVLGIVPAGTSFWIGLTDASSEGTWVWVDGTPFDYWRWSSGEPDDTRGGQDCARVGAGGGPWSSERCRDSHAAVCERERD
ncbi:MAG: hypothetical protein IT379_09895 [Deltaproteobacteria bacterium]|nr:hypothetical protein [Deltaproteobacteria bacterium]